MAEKPAKHKRKLIVTSSTVLHTGTNKRGDAFTLYEVEATNPDGQVIGEPLRSFQQLPTGTEVEVEITPYDKPGYERTFTLAMPRANTTARIAELEERVTELEGRVRSLYDHMHGTAPSPEPPEPQPEPVAADSGSRWGDDPPY